MHRFPTFYFHSSLEFKNIDIYLGNYISYIYGIAQPRNTGCWTVGSGIGNGHPRNPQWREIGLKWTALQPGVVLQDSLQSFRSSTTSDPRNGHWFQTLFKRQHIMVSVFMPTSSFSSLSMISSWQETLKYVKVETSYWHPSIK